MRVSSFALLISVASISTSVSGDLIDQLSGTQEVKYKSLDFSGVTKGCELSYLFAERKFSKGNPVLHAMSGSLIFIRSGENKFGFGIKLGVRDLSRGVSFQRPNYIYLTSENGSTVGEDFSIIDEDPGFRLVVVNAVARKNVSAVLADVLSGKKVKIGYNWSQDGLDDSIDLDLTVVGISKNENGGVEKEKSYVEIEKFGVCMTKVLGR